MGEVRIEHVRQQYGAVVALDDVSLAVARGTFLSLLGASGAGKSTLLRILGGFERPVSGRILLDGEDITPLPPHRRRLNTVFQDYALFPHMTVAENVAYGLKRDGLERGERSRRVREALDMLQIEALAARHPHELSGGQQQRVALARALVKQPPVLLLDEPLGALDRKLRQHVQIELKQLQRKLGTTFIFVTHDQEEALALSDQVAVMRDGRIEQLDAPAALYDRPCSEFVAGFIGRNNFLPGRRAAIRPENVRLLDSVEPATTSAVAGRIVASVVLGETIEYLFESNDRSQQLTVHSPRHRSANVRREGDACHAVWDERDVQVFSR